MHRSKGYVSTVNVVKLEAILKRARGFIADGWCQGSMYIGDSVCLVGGVDRAAQNSSDYHAVLLYLQLFLPDRAMYLTSWNDRPERTKEEVLELYDKAIASCSQ